VNEEKKEIKLTVDHTGGCAPFVGEIIVALIVIFVVLPLVVQGVADLFRQYWWILALLGATALIVWAVDYSKRMQWEENMKRTQESSKAEGRARQAELERDRRESQARLAEHQRRMREDEIYRDKCLEITRREMVAFELDVDPSNPFIEEKLDIIEDTLVWEEAYANIFLAADMIRLDKVAPDS